MRKWIAAVLTAALMTGLFGYVDGPVVNAKTEASYKQTWLDTSSLHKGVVSIDYPIKAKIKTKLKVSLGNNSYMYNLTGTKRKDRFPLQMGNGNYKFEVYEQISGTRYKRIATKEASVKMDETSLVYLNAVQNVNWSKDSKAVIKANELTKGLKTAEEKIKKIHAYITSNIRYDNKLAAAVQSDYLPDIDKTLHSNKAICYDYASLFAAMLRSQGIPAKLVMGNSSYVSVYHAWNEVYMNGKWVIIDTTVDAGWKASNKKIHLIKDQSKYKTAKVY